jgi:hypothetical protein
LTAISDLSGFTKKCGNGTPKCAIEFIGFKRAHERFVERNQDVRRQSVEVPAVPAIEPPDATSEGECVVAYRADPILRLPIPTSFDGDLGMERVVDGVPKQLMRGGRRFLRLFDNFPEDEPKLGAARAELGRWRKRQIKLQAMREQEHSVDDRAARKVEQLDRPELTNDGPGPPFQHLRHRHVVCDCEHEVEI